MFRNAAAHLIGGVQHHRVPALFHGQGFIETAADVGAVPLDTVQRVLGKGDWLFRRGRFDGDQGRHDLGDAGGIQLFVNVFGIKDFLSV